MNWATHGAPLLLTLALWWGSTAVIARLIGHTPRSYPRLLLLATLLGVAGLFLLVGLRDTTSVAAAVGALVGAITVWGWIEVTFLTGKVTGPLPTHSAEDEGLIRRAGRAFTAILWHEILIAVTVAMAAVLLLGRDRRRRAPADGATAAGRVAVALESRQSSGRAMNAVVARAGVGSP
ncbi:MAG: DUF3623 family protein [Gammaproteobacteria bacterium]|nr:DUF3623 family protein [Gammaproteobacteria bacterium]